MRPFVEDYLAGRTPIPCALCNNHVKFEQLLVTARQIGASRIATGPLRARALRNAATGRYHLFRAAGPFQGPVVFSVWAHSGAVVARDLSPGRIYPSTTCAKWRAAAPICPWRKSRKARRSVLCPRGITRDFIEAYRREQARTEPASSRAGKERASPCERNRKPPKPASWSPLRAKCSARTPACSTSPSASAAAWESPPPRPLYVLQIDSDARAASPSAKRAELWRDTCEVRDVNWIAWDHSAEPVEALVKIRYRHEPAAAVIEPRATAAARVRFHAPQRAITPGQAAVFYSGDEVLGGGWIR